MKRVFVSSTCHDLIDVRAELEEHLRRLGLIPVVSDSGTSAFELNPNRESIDVCLENVKSSDVVLVILSQRYGASLAITGYPDLSATHLEYRTAQEANVPIYFYVRDRLAAEHSHWHKNGGKSDDPSDFAFAPKKDALRLFRFIDEHQKLIKDGRNNWTSQFSSSVHLKTLVSKDLARHANAAVLARLIEAGKLPVLSISPSHSNVVWPEGELILHINVRNGEPLLDLRIAAGDGDERPGKAIGDFIAPPRGTRGPALTFSFHSQHIANDNLVRLTYATLSGHRIEDTIEVWVPHESQPAEYRHTKRRLLDYLTYELE